MTFGVGSPGFDPFYCPPCNAPPGSICNMMCVDPIDLPLLLVGVTVLVFAVGVWLRRGDSDD